MERGAWNPISQPKKKKSWKEFSATLWFRVLLFPWHNSFNAPYNDPIDHLERAGRGQKFLAAFSLPLTTTLTNKTMSHAGTRSTLPVTAWTEHTNYRSTNTYTAFPTQPHYPHPAPRVE